MPLKKSKVRKDIINPEKVYEFLTWEQVQTKEQKLKNHIINLQDCVNYIKESSVLVSQHNEKQLILNKWQQYINCCPLPKAYIPPEIRLFMEKLKYFENISKDETNDWLLYVNERSILTQNLFNKNLTHSILKQTQKKNFGLEYNKDIEFCLKIIKRLDDFLDNSSEVVKCNAEKLKDIKELRGTVQQEISEFFNRFTYRILCSEESYMNSIDAITAEYSFQAENFQMHIWCLKNVPIRFKQIEETHFVANLHGVKITLHIPTFILQENFTIRALHMNFDHISEKVKNFQTEIMQPSEVISTAEQDLIECITNEWLIQLNIQNQLRNELLEKRQKYEEQLRVTEEQEEKAKTKRKNDKDNEKSSKIMKTKKPKHFKEPLNITDDMFPDIREYFLQEEQKQYENSINTLYNPKSLDLDDDEINLKQYFILGGIYQLYQVKKPKHFDFNTFNMTWHYNDSKLVIDENVQIPWQAKCSRSSRAYKSTTARNPSLKIEEFKNPKNPWFILTIQLPEYLCYWSQPIACQYESISKIKPINFTPLVVNEVSINSNEQISTQQIDKIPKLVSKYPPFLKPQKGNLSDSVLQIQQFSKESFFRTSLSNVRLAAKNYAIEHFARDLEGVLNISDFPLTKLLNKSQIRLLQRHVIPRIISSFKFPKEIYEDELKAFQGKSKTKGGLLVRKHIHTTAENLPINRNIFTFGPMQNNPERLIALYPSTEPIRILQQEDVDENDLRGDIKEPRSFTETIKLFNYLKWQYKLRIRKILDLKPFKSKFPISNKRLEAIRKQKLKLPVSISTLPSPHLTKSRSRFQTIRRSQKKSATSRYNFLETSVSNILSTSLQDSSSETLVTEDNQVENKKENVTEENLPTYSYNHWTTQHILKSEYDQENRTFQIQTDRLGYFGFAFKQYEHFPFKSWKLEPSPEDPENEVIFTVDTQYVRCVIYITDKGYKGHVTEPTEKFVRNPKMYLIIEEFKADLKEFKKIFKENNLNIFADKDACFYIENGYFSEKHMSTELHTYNCMAIHSTHIKFQYSHWNRLAERRDIILKFLQYQDAEENVVEVRITPEESFFVQTSELCSDNVDIIKLNYTLTWRNINIYSDLHNLINSMYPAANEMKCKNVELMNFLRNLLCEIRPLSFS